MEMRSLCSWCLGELRHCPQVFPGRLVRFIVCCEPSVYIAFLNLIVDGKVEPSGRVKAFFSLLSFPFTFYFRLFDPGLFESFSWNENESLVILYLFLVEMETHLCELADVGM